MKKAIAALVFLAALVAVVGIAGGVEQGAISLRGGIIGGAADLAVLLASMEAAR